MNYAPTVIDFHAHILPNIDHGCRSLEECKKQLELIRSNKTDTVVATPHFYPHVHRIDDFKKSLKESINSIKLANFENTPQIFVGAEVLLCENLSEMDGLSELCINGTKAILLELPMSSLKEGHFDTVEKMLANGFTVILAHVDRYLKICPYDLDTLRDMGVLMQVNASALSPFSVHGRLKRYVEERRVCALGSDLHGANPSDYKKFAKAPYVLKNHYIDIMNSSQKLLENAIMI